jgi:hypothetical protein
MSYHLDSVTLHRFRGIEELALGGLGRANLLVGGNNSGKTSILESLAVLSDPLDLRSWFSASRRREPPPYFPIDLVRQLHWLFPQRGEAPRGSTFKGQVHLSASGSFQVREVKASLEETRVVEVSPSRESANTTASI